MNVEISEASQGVYLDRLRQLSPEQMTEATRRTIDEWREPSKMPPLAFILDRAGVNPQLAAEAAWETVHRLISRHWYADGIGWTQDADKKLTPAMRYAIRQCGGEHRMAYSEEKDFPWIRKTFLEAHTRFAVEGGQQVALSHQEAKGFLEGILGKDPKDLKGME